MRNVSDQFKEAIKTRTNFYMTAEVVFADGKKLSLDRAAFYINGNSFTDSAGSNAFPLGVALQKQVTISLVNDTDQYQEYDFYGARFTISCSLDLDDGTTESILIGTFTVTSPEDYGSTVTVTAVDDMYKGDQTYYTNSDYPMTIGQALIDSCETCGVTIRYSTFKNDDYVLQTEPTGLTHRMLWGLIAMIAGGNARMDEYNRLQIITWDFASLDDPESKYHLFDKSQNITVATDDVVITGVQTTVNNVSYNSGAVGYMLTLDNQLFANNPQDAITRVGKIVNGARFRPFTLDRTAYPLAEFGDLCTVVDRKGNEYQSIITDMSFAWYGITTIKCTADSPLRNSSRYYSQAEQEVIKTRNDTKKDLSDYDKTVQSLTSLITQSFGAYKTEEKQADGSTIYYMHDKPTLAESQNIWRMSANVFSVSDDGGKTWKAGMDSSGNAVMNVVNVVGLNADYINTGTLVAKDADGNIVLSINVETGQVSINAEAIKMATGSLKDYAEFNDKKVAEIASEAGQVSVTATDEQGTLSSVINTKSWETKYVDANDNELCAIRFNPLKKQFEINGRLQISDGFTVADDGLLITKNMLATGLMLLDGNSKYTQLAQYKGDYFTICGKGENDISLGFTTKNVGGLFLSKASMLAYKNGVFWGTGYGTSSTIADTFYPSEGLYGIFIDTEKKSVYVVNGLDSQEIYTGSAIARFG